MASNFSFDGVISGLKTGEIVQRLIALERRPLDLLQQRKAQEEVRSEAIQAIRDLVAGLSTTVAKLVRPGQLTPRTATVEGPSGPSAAVAVTAGAGAVNGTFTINVSQIAAPTLVLSAGPIGRAVDSLVPLASAGFRSAPVTMVNGQPATFSINGTAISIDSSTTLDDGTANSVIAKINAAGAGVTASLIADADGRAGNRVQLVSAPGQGIAVGSLGDTSDLLQALNLSNAVAEGVTAARVTGGAVAAGALNTSITVNGVTIPIVQSNGSFTAAQNAAAIVAQINTTPGLPVRAIDNGNGTFAIEQKALGSAFEVTISAAGAETGLAVSTTKNGTDRMVSTMSLGSADSTASLTNARLVTPISGLSAGGQGAFSINGVQISYAATDSIAGIIQRINASMAGVTATYDPGLDRIRLTASQTGARTISVQDVTGNFLQATGILSGSQTLGKQAVFTIDAVNGGQPLTSSSNTVSGYLPGLTFQLKSPTATPLTVTVGPDTRASMDLVKSFVDGFNSVLSAIATRTAVDPKREKSGPLAGDRGLASIERTLREFASAPALGLTGQYRSLADIGISTGSVGSAVGTTNRLVIDEARLQRALNENPQAVEAVLSGFLARVGTPSGTGNVSGVSGTPIGQHESGTYHLKVLDAAARTVEVRFVSLDGRELMRKSGVLAAGAEDAALIPGLRISLNSVLAAGEDTFALTVDSRGVLVKAKDRLDLMLQPDGLFDSRLQASEAISLSITRRTANMEQRLKDKEAALVQKFAALEAALARLQMQSSALNSQIARMTVASRG
jgi:flagellar hook-associated protein 2